MVDLKNVDYATASAFTRLSTNEIKSLKPITILLSGAIPIAVVVQYDTFIQMQDELDSWKERARKHGCDVVNGDSDCG